MSNDDSTDCATVHDLGPEGSNSQPSSSSRELGTFPAEEPRPKAKYKYESSLSYRECPKTWHVTCSVCGASGYARKGELASWLEQHAEWHEQDRSERRTVTSHTINQTTTVALLRSGRIVIKHSEMRRGQGPVAPPEFDEVEARHIANALQVLADKIDQDDEDGSSMSSLRQEYEEYRHELERHLDYDLGAAAMETMATIVGETEVPRVTREQLPATSREPDPDIRGQDRKDLLDDLAEQPLAQELSWEILFHALRRQWVRFELPRTTPFQTVRVAYPAYSNPWSWHHVGPHFDVWDVATVEERIRNMQSGRHLVWSSYAGLRNTAELMWGARNNEEATIAAWCRAVGHDEHYMGFGARLVMAAGERLAELGVNACGYHHKSKAVPVRPNEYYASCSRFLDVGDLSCGMYSTYRQLAEWIAMCVAASLASSQFVRVLPEEQDSHLGCFVDDEPEMDPPKPSLLVVPQPIQALPSRSVVVADGVREAADRLVAGDDMHHVSSDLQRLATELEESPPTIEAERACAVLTAFVTSWASRRPRWHVGHRVIDSHRFVSSLVNTEVDPRNQWNRAFFLARWAAGDALVFCLRRHEYLPGVSEALAHVEAAPGILDGVTAREAAEKLDDAANVLASGLVDWSRDDSASLSVRDAIAFLSVACTATRAAAVWLGAYDASLLELERLNETTVVASWCPQVPCEFPDGVDPDDLPSNWAPGPWLVGYFVGVVASQVLDDPVPMIWSLTSSSQADGADDDRRTD